MVASPRDSFGGTVKEYVAGRPDYPEALIADLPLDGAHNIIDLGAGTGKFTRQLAGAGRAIVAVEPEAKMAAQIARHEMPGVTIVQASAERVPLPDASADLICCATAFHWFDYVPATAEIVRLLRPSGHLALIWNVRDDNMPWVAAVSRLLDSYAGDTPRYSRGTWRVIFDDARFRHVTSKQYGVVQRVGRTGVHDRVFSTSFIAALPPAEQDAVRREVDAIVADDATIRDAEEIAFPYRSDLHLFRRT